MLTTTQIKDLILNNLPNNQANLITPEKLREVFNEMSDSYTNLITNSSNLGLTEYDSNKSYAAGKTAIFDGVLYQANTQTTTGDFLESEWSAIGGEGTNGTDNFVLQTNAFELEDNKLCKGLEVDQFLRDLETGFYTTKTPTLFGLDEEYPINKKGMVQTFKSVDGGIYGMQFYYTFDGQIFIRDLNMNDWILISSEENIDYSFGNGLEENNGNVELNGQFQTINLNGNLGSVFSLISETINLNGNLDLTGNLDITGELEVDQNTLLKGVTEIDNNLTVTGTTDIQDLTVSGTVNFDEKVKYVTNPFGEDFDDVQDLDVPNVALMNYQIDQKINNSTAGIGSDFNVLAATNGLSVIGNNIGLGGTLNQNTEITGDFDFNLSPKNVVIEGAYNYENLKIENNSDPYTHLQSLTDTGLYMNSSQVELKRNLDSIFLDGSKILLTRGSTSLKFDGSDFLFTTASGNSFLIGASQTIYTDLYGNGGIRYAADYSNDFVNESLVSKKYVDNAININSADAENGLTSDNGTIRLGGTLQNLTKINTNNNNFELSNPTDANQAYFRIGSNIIMHDGMQSDRSYISLSGGFLNLEHQNGTGIKGFKFSSTQALFTDSIHTKGLEYATDYSSNFTDNSLVTKKYVDDLTPTVSGFYNIGNLGTSLNWNATDIKKIRGVLTNNIVINITNVIDGAEYQFNLTQDATGGHNVSFTHDTLTVKFANGATSAEISTLPNHKNKIYFEYDGADLTCDIGLGYV